MSDITSTAIVPSPLGEGVTAVKAVTDEVKGAFLEVNLIRRLFRYAAKPPPSPSGEGFNADEVVSLHSAPVEMTR